MSPEDLKTLFKPFYRTSDKASLDINKDSHGLGLSICKLLAERMNGSLSASSTIGLGSIVGTWVEPLNSKCYLWLI